MKERSWPLAELAVLVVGAGPTGLTLACDLARRGVRFRLIDRAREPFVGSRGKGLQPRTLEIFEDLGVIGQVLAQGAEYPEVRVHTPWFSFPWRLQEREPRTSAVPYPNVWLLPQANTEAILRARLAELGGEVERATELVSFVHDPAGVTATLRRPDGGSETVRSRYLVGADGGHSAVRKALGMQFTGAPIEELKCVVGDVRVEGLDRDAWHVWPWARGGPVSLCPLPHGDLFQLFAQLRSDAEIELSERGVDALIRHALRATALRVRDPSWLSLYRPNVRMVEHYRVGPVFLAGDAAHVHPPTGAQGLNVGVQDAYNLGWKLAAVLSGAPDALLDSYEEERRPVAAEVLGLSTAIFAQKWRRRGPETKQLQTSYRASSLATELHCAPLGLRAGDRAPDATLLDAHGQAQRLFQVLHGPHATLLTFGPAALRAAGKISSRRDLKVVEVGTHNLELRRLYGVGGDDEVVLVRPDGYVGLVARAPRPRELSAYLDRIGLAPVQSV